MAIHVGWDNDIHTLVTIEFQRGWTWQDLNVAIARADELISSQTHTVHLVIDIQKAGGIPRDFMARAGDLFAQGEARANEGQKVVIGAGGLIRMAYKGFLAVYGNKLENRPFVFADDMPSARALLVG